MGWSQNVQPLPVLQRRRDVPTWHASVGRLGMSPAVWLNSVFLMWQVGEQAHQEADPLHSAQPGLAPQQCAPGRGVL
jgi:hypothetical protein